MNKTKIAIIDSGIDIKNRYLSQYIESGKSFLFDTKLEVVLEGTDIEDNHGHGTACAYTILRRNENVSITPIKIIDESGRTNTKCLLKALEFLKETDIKLINISLATVDFNYKDELFKVCNELTLLDKIIVASLDNRSRNSLPAVLSNVIGVQGKNFSNTDNYWYNKKYDIQCVCDDEPILVPDIEPNKLNLFGRNSKSTAVMTANISKLLSIDSSLNYNELEKILNKNAIRNTWDNSNLKSCIKNIDEIIIKNDLKEKVNILCKLIIDTYKLDISDYRDIYENPLFSSITNMNRDNFYQLIYAMEEHFNIKIDYDKISRKTFDSIYGLLNILE